MMDSSRPGVTNLFAITAHFVTYRWVSGPHNFLVILWNLLKTNKIVQQKQTASIQVSPECLADHTLQSKSFDTLDDLLGFQVQKLWSKVIKIFD